MNETINIHTKSIGDNTPPCLTPVSNGKVKEEQTQYCTYTTVEKNPGGRTSYLCHCKNMDLYV